MAVTDTSVILLPVLLFETIFLTPVYTGAKLCCFPHHPVEGCAQVALMLFFSLTRRSSSCYLGEGVPIIYSLHSPGARLTRWVSD